MEQSRKRVLDASNTTKSSVSNPLSAIEIKATEIARDKNITLKEFSEWLLNNRHTEEFTKIYDISNNEKRFIGSTISIMGITFKILGLCRYYDVYAKFTDQPDNTYQLIQIFRD